MKISNYTPKVSRLQIQLLKIKDESIEVLCNTDQRCKDANNLVKLKFCYKFYLSYSETIKFQKSFLLYLEKMQEQLLSEKISNQDHFIFSFTNKNQLHYVSIQRKTQDQWRFPLHFMDALIQKLKLRGQKPIYIPQPIKMSQSLKLQKQFDKSQTEEETQEQKVLEIVSQVYKNEIIPEKKSLKSQTLKIEVIKEETILENVQSSKKKYKSLKTPPKKKWWKQDSYIAPDYESETDQ